MRLKSQHAPIIGLLTVLAIGCPSGLAVAANQAGSITAAPLATGAIDETKLVPLAGNTHPLALPKYDQGAVPDTLAMGHVLLQLQRSPQLEAALDSVMRERQDQHSPTYHKWLTADELGKNFGPAQQDIDTVVGWLTSHGLHVNEVSKTGLTIDFSGTAAQVSETFHTAIHSYNVNGQLHIANASDPEIPAALAPVVAGVVSLNNFRPKPQLRKPSPNFSLNYGGSEFYLVAPADFATIYNVKPLYKGKKRVTGKGQTVVVIEDTDMNPADVATFRSAFGLSSYSGTFSQVHPGSGCTDPGVNGDEGEAAVDAEWAGAIAPDADVELASCADTVTNFGGFIAAQGLLDSATPPPIFSVSYGSCEAANGPGFNAYIASLWQQAAIEGVSVFVSAGDGSAAGCDDFDTSSFAIAGIAANAFASTPYNVATGGTDFLDTAEGLNSTYWSETNTSKGKSALSYVPETTWNDSCAGSLLYEYYGYTDGLTFCNSAIGSNFLDIVGGSGAPSIIYSKPYWQNAAGIPKDGKRDLPDVSLFASNGFWYHAILFCMSDATEGGTTCDYSNPLDTLSNIAGGTSFTAPQFASIQALINEKSGGPQGNPAPIFYDLARAEYGSRHDPHTGELAACNASDGNAISSSCIFHDVTVGNNDVPCYGTNNCFGSSADSYGVLSTSDKHLKIAYPTTAAWDFATGLGSVNVANLVKAWPGGCN